MVPSLKITASEDAYSLYREALSHWGRRTPIAIRLAKLQLYKGLQMDLETAMKVAAACETITLTSDDHREGVAAFREKRKPQYKGR